MSYTKVPKPGAQTYTKTNAFLENYDGLVIYDDPNTPYDGINPNQYTKITKPSGTTYTKIAKPV